MTTSNSFLFLWTMMALMNCGRIPKISCIYETKSWMANNLLQLNESETSELLVYTRFNRRKPLHISLIIGSSLNLPSFPVWNLGVIMDSSLIMGQYFKRTCFTAYLHLRPITDSRLGNISHFINCVGAIEIVFVYSKITAWKRSNGDPIPYQLYSEDHRKRSTVTFILYWQSSISHFRYMNGLIHY